MRVPPLVLVGLGGAVGSLVRHGVTAGSASSTLAVFALNVVGSLTLGSATAWLQQSTSIHLGDSGAAREHWAALVGVGFCGGLTTFSTHMVDVARQLDSSMFSDAIASLVGTAVLAVGAAWAGHNLTRRAIRAGQGTTP